MGVKHTQRVLVDHHLYAVCLRVYQCLPIFDLQQKHKVKEWNPSNIYTFKVFLFGHLALSQTFITLSLCRSEQYPFIYIFTFHHTAVIWIYAKKLPFLLPIYHLEHCLKHHPRKKNICWSGMSVEFLDLDSSQHSSFSPHFISLMISWFGLGFKANIHTLFPKPYIIDNIIIFSVFSLLQKGERQTIDIPIFRGIWILLNI